MKTIAMCALLAALAFGLLPGNRDEAAAPDEGLVLLVETQQDAQAPQKASSARQNQSEKAAVQTAPDAQTVRLLDSGAVTALSMEDYLTGRRVESSLRRALVTSTYQSQTSFQKKV